MSEIIKWTPEAHGLMKGGGYVFDWSIERHMNYEYGWRLLRRGGRFAKGREPTVIGQFKTVAKAQDIAEAIEQGAHTWAEDDAHE